MKHIIENEVGIIAPAGLKLPPPTDAQTWLDFDLEAEIGAIWENQWKARFFTRKRRQIKNRKKK